MLLSYNNLDDETRRLMLAEIDHDIASNQLYLSPRLSDSGRADYPQLLMESARCRDDEWLANQLRGNGRLNVTEPRRTKSGITNAKVPYNANETLAEGEFNRFYIRALCLRAMTEGCSLIVYRAKEVTNARLESQAKIGQAVNPSILLADLRCNPGIDTALGLPSGPNSGLSVKL